MSFPAFFDQVPRITTYDPLAEFLGAASDGRMEYAYVDAVRLAGHSCPTVAGAWLCTLKGLRALFGDAPAERGAVKLSFRGQADEGTVGVIANVMGLVTGAAGEGGFKGLGGNFHRNGLVSFGDESIGGQVRMSTGRKAVDVTFNHSVVPFPPQLGPSLGAALHPHATSADRQVVGDMFQARVHQILIEHWDDPALVTVTAVA